MAAALLSYAEATYESDGLILSLKLAKRWWHFRFRAVCQP